MSIQSLRQQIIDVVQGVTAEAPPAGLPTGITGLDSLLPSNGIPRGRITELLGERGAGRTTLLRRIVGQVVRSGLWVAYIDATRTLAPAHWAHIGSRNMLWVVRPPPGDAGRGAWCADVLLRSGAFALVVLDGAPVLNRSIAVRLSRLARDSNSAFIVTGDERNATMLGGSLRLRLKRIAPRIRNRKRRVRDRWFSIAVEKGGSPRIVEVCCAIGVEGRLCTHPEVPDRRGVARARRGKWGTTVSAGRYAALG
jgi:hypothetical protein